MKKFDFIYGTDKEGNAVMVVIYNGDVDYSADVVRRNGFDPLYVCRCKEKK